MASWVFRVHFLGSRAMPQVYRRIQMLSRDDSSLNVAEEPLEGGLEHVDLLVTAHASRHRRERLREPASILRGVFHDVARLADVSADREQDSVRAREPSKRLALDP